MAAKNALKSPRCLGSTTKFSENQWKIEICRYGIMPETFGFLTDEDITAARSRLRVEREK